MLPVILAAALVSGGNTFWGDVGAGAYVGRSYKVAPNGLTYKPMFRLVADLNIGSEDWYVFAKSAYYAEKPQPGVTTNKHQGQFDFTKRQYDFDVGMAFALAAQTEIRLWTYSQSNINRGNDLNKPYGFKDGAVLALRRDSDIVDYRVRFEGGYYITKELADNAGNSYEPGFFGEATLTLPFVAGIHGLAGGRAVLAKESGVRQFDSRLGLQRHWAGTGGQTDVGLYFERDFGMRQTPELNRVLLEFRLPIAGR